MCPEQPFAIPTAAGGLLNAVLSPPAPDRTNGGPLVILCHGFTGSKTADGRLLVGLARELAAGGLAALRFDFFGSGDSGGEFAEMTPNTEVEDLKHVVCWALAQGFGPLGLLGHSLGGAVVFCAAEQMREPAVRALAGWCTVPAFAHWRVTPDDPADAENPMRPGPRFWTDRPAVDVPEAFRRLSATPRLQVQGDADLPGFLEQFRVYFEAADGPKTHLVLPGADHCFTRPTHRREVTARTVAWFQHALRG